MNTPQTVPPLAEHTDPEMGHAERGFILALIIVPILGLAYGIWDAWGDGVDWFYLSLMAFFYVITALGITVGFHRLLTHESFKAKPWVKFILTVWGCMAYQGRPLVWCPNHSDHHQHSDKEGDPHSPHRFGEGFWALFKGFWYAQFVWLLIQNNPIENKCTRSLKADRVVAFVDRYTLLWMILSGLIPAGLGFLHDHSLVGVWRGFLWGGLVRLFLLQHVTWAINSYCHIWGKTTFRSGDHSKDSIVFGIIAMGEGFHNGHHAFSWSAVHGILRPWLDASYLFIKALEKCRLAWDVRVPSPALIQTKLIKA